MSKNRILTVATLIMMITVILHAETWLRYKRTTDPYTAEGKSYPAATAYATAWVGSKQAVYEDGEGHRSIMTFATRTLTIIDSSEKSYTILKLDSISSMIDQVIDENTDNAESAAAMKAMMQGIMGTVLKGAMTVTNTGEEQKIGAWQCSRYIVSVNLPVAATKSDMWITEQIKIDAAAFNMVKNGMMALIPGFTDIAQEIEKIKGIPVKTVSSAQAMGSTITTTELLLESAVKQAPAAVFSIPEGFSQQTLSGD